MDNNPIQLPTQNHGINQNQPKYISALQINTCRSYTAMQEIARHAITNNINIIIVSEPYIGNTGRPPKLPPYEGLFHSQYSKDEPIKAAIYYNPSNLTARTCHDYTDTKICTVDIMINNSQLRLTSVYLPPRPSDPELKSFINKLQQILTTSPTESNIIAGDLNAHHSSWNKSKRNDNVGEAIIELIMSKDLTLSNTPYQPTFYCPSRNVSSTVDLTISTQNIIYDWHVNENISTLSDHNAILFKITPSANNSEGILTNIRPSYNRIKSTYKYDTSRVDWHKFGSKISKYLDRYYNQRVNIKDIDNPSDLEEAISKLVKMIIRFCNQNIPKKKPHFNSTTACEWWTDEHNELKKKTNILKHRYQNHKKKCTNCTHSEFLEEYLQAKFTYSKTLSTDSAKHFKSFLESFNNIQHIKRLKTIAANLERPMEQGVNLNNHFKFNEITTTQPLDTMSKFMDHFFQDDNLASIDNITANTSSEDQHPITTSELINTINSFSNQKAPGFDGLTPDIVKSIINSNIDLFTEIYNKCYTMEYFPVIWKKSIIKILKKPNKDDYSKPNAYRPIGLLPVFGKILEKIIYNRLNFDLEKKRLISYRQFGFRRNRSAVQAINYLVNTVKNSKSKRRHTAAIFLDINKAFDSISYVNILRTLNTYKVPKNIFNIIKHYLTNRTIEICNGSSKISRQQTKGAVQGSILGPLLWNIIINTILLQSFPVGVEVVAFADDIAILVSLKSIPQLERSCQETIKAISEWCEHQHLALSAEKTVFIPFTNSLKDISLTINNAIITPSQSTKYLGIVVDKYLSFKEHVNQLCEKVSKFNIILQRLVKPTWGLNPQIVRTFYLSVIEPIMLYGSSIWSKVINTKAYQNKLLRIQRKYLLSATKAFHTTSNTALQIIANIPPINLKIIERSMVEQTFIDPFQPEIKSNQVAGIIENKNKSTPLIIENKTEEIIHPTTFPIIFPKEFNNQDEINHYNRESVSDLDIYTDGSKDNEENVNAAAVFMQNGRITKIKTFKLHHLCSNYQAENFAIYKALSNIMASNSSSKYGRIKIFTDSHSTILAINNPRCNEELIAKIRSKIIECKRNNLNIEVHWVKAHNGIIGNELADTYAKNARKNKNASLKYNKISKLTVKTLIKEHIKRQWQTQIDTSNTGSHTKKKIPNIKIANIVHRNIGISYFTTQVITEHSVAKEYLKRFNIKNNDHCYCSNKTQSIEHLLQKCPAWTKTRKELVNNIKIKTNEITNMEIIANMSKDKIDLWHNYIEKIIKQTNKINNT